MPEREGRVLSEKIERLKEEIRYLKNNKEKFLKEPEKYLSKLPQFKKQ